jgi:hypothetical protein
VIDDPEFTDASVGRWDPVLGLAHNGEAKAYPLALLHHFELVNDVIGGKPVAVGY